jgi:hypothetical protein
MYNESVYDKSCRKVEGAIVSSSGTIEKRNGSTYRGDTEFSTETYDTFTSTAVKLIPFRVGTDTYVLVFEVIRQEVGSEFLTWGSIRVVKNDVFYTSTGSDTYTGTQIWKEYTHTHLPFRTEESIGISGSIALHFLPPGSDASFSKLFGWHHFTAAQLPDVTYFQHEDNLIVCHPNAAPLEVFRTIESDGTKVLDTRMYDVHRRSPEIIRYGERFTMTVTASEASGGNYTVETTRDWFGEEDIGAIYRIGSLRVTRPFTDDDIVDVPTTVREEWDDRGGLFAIVLSVDGPRKCSMSVISDYKIYHDGGTTGTNFTTYQAEVSDPYDWDGPWIKEDAKISYRYLSMGSAFGTLAVPKSGVDILQGRWINPGQQSAGIEYNTTLEDGTPFHAYSLAGCILGNRANDSATYPPANLDRECYVLMTGDLQAGGSTYLYQVGMIINGNQVHTTEVPGWTDAASDRRFDIPIVNQNLFRLRKKSSSKEYAPTVTWSPGHPVSSAYLDLPVMTDGFIPNPATGDKVYICVGNITPTVLGNWKIAYESIPEGHGLSFESGEKVADIGEAPSATNVIEDTGGTVHVNGGVFALRHSTHLVNGVVYISATVLVPPTSRSATSKYSLGWSKAVGFPSCGISHQGRVIFGGFDLAKRVVVGSEPDRPFDFGLGGTSADGFHFLVNDLRGSRIRWLSSGKDLLIGTSTGEFSITGSPLSPISVGVDRQSAYGSASVRPVIAGVHLLFVQKDRKTLRAMKFNFENQRYISKNITQEHTHFFSSATIEEMVVWEGQEDPVVLVRLSDGEVLACRVNEIDGFYGWSRMKLPLCSSIVAARNYTAGVTASATAVDSFYMATTDTDKYRINQYDDTLYLDEAEVPTFGFSSGGVTVTKLFISEGQGSASLGQGGSQRFDGQSVSVVLEGVYLGEFPVSHNTLYGSWVDGVYQQGITAESNVLIGRKINMAMQPRVPEVASSTRSVSTLGRVKNYSSVVVCFNGAQGPKVNGFEADPDFILPTTTAPAVLTGWHETPVVGLYGVQPLLELSSDRPYPVEIAAITIDVSVEG